MGLTPFGAASRRTAVLFTSVLVSKENRRSSLALNTPT